MLNCTKNFIFPIKLLLTGFLANDKWRQAPGFDLLPHKGRRIHLVYVAVTMVIWRDLVLRTVD